MCVCMYSKKEWTVQSSVVFFFLLVILLLWFLHFFPPLLSPFVLPIILLFSYPLSFSSFVLKLTFSPSFLLAVLLLFHALFYPSPMCVIPSPLLPSNNSVQISVRHWVPKYSIYQDKQKINTHPTQTQHTGSSADLPMTLAHALQLSSVITELKRQKEKTSFGCIKSIRNALQFCTWQNSIHLFYYKATWQSQYFTVPNVKISMTTDFEEWYLWSFSSCKIQRSLQKCNGVNCVKCGFC